MNRVNPVRTSRREFLRLCWLGAAGAIAAACSRASPSPTAAIFEPAPSSTVLPEVLPTVTPVSPPAGIVLAGKGADAWAWDVPVTGTIENPDACSELSLIVNGTSQAAKIEENTFTASARLIPGGNRVVVRCEGKDAREEFSNMIQFTERLEPRPKARIRPALVADQLVLDASQSQADESSASAIIDRVWSADQNNPGRASIVSTDGAAEREFTGEVSAERISLRLPPVDGEYYFRLQVLDELGRQDSSAIYVEVMDGKVRIPDYDKENPAWVEKAVVYGVIPRLFGNYGFRSITERLDYLQELGVNALWLAPVNVSPPGDYGYAVVDYFNLNPQYGSKEDFHRMVQEAHARGMRVLMDFVPNHSSAQHPYFLDAEANGESSPYWGFYDRDEQGEPTHYFDWTHLPNLNYENTQVRRWITEAFAYWVREFGVDGFRVDVAWGVKQRRPDYWIEWRQELKRIKPDLLLLAEASARDPYYFDNGFDAAYDWTDQLGKWAWELVWGSYKNRLLAYNLESALTNRPSGYHPDALVFRFLNNNDTGERFITKHGEGMARVSTALLLTLPGLPCIYTGDEIGAAYRPYYDPDPLTWEEKVPGFVDYHKRLISLRKTLPSLHSRHWQVLDFKPVPQEVFAYLRYLEPAERPVVVLLNFYEEDAVIEFQAPEGFDSLGTAQALHDQLSEQEFQTTGGGGFTIPVPALSARILTIQGSA